MQEIDDLIKEDTLPAPLKLFRDFDVNYMMPIFKRPVEERMDGDKPEPMVEQVDEGAEEGGEKDSYFNVYNNDEYMPFKWSVHT